MLDLGLVLAGADGAEVLRASGRISPCSDARSDWYTRRLGGPVGHRGHAGRLTAVRQAAVPVGGRARMAACPRPDVTNQAESSAAAIDRVGYYPAVVADAVEAALCRARRSTSFVIHHEPTFDHDEVRRHVTVLGA